MSEIELSELSEEQKDKLLSNPNIRRMLEYEDSSLPEIANGIVEMQESDEFEMEGSREVVSDGVYSLLVEGIAERSGRTTESTVHKVLSGLVEEYEETGE